MQKILQGIKWTLREIGPWLFMGALLLGLAMIEFPAQGQSPSKAAVDDLQLRAKAAAAGMQAQGAVAPQAQPANKSAVEAAQERAKALSEKMKIENRPQGEADASFDGKRFNDVYQKELERQRQTVFAPMLEGSEFSGKSGQEILRTGKDPRFTPLPGEGERIYILVSSSMPSHVIRNYLKSAKKLGNPRIEVLIRGLVQDGMPQTMEWVRPLIMAKANCREEGCEQVWRININPNPFRDFGVTKVPAIVWSKRETRGGQPSPADFALIYGDGSLNSAIKTFAEAGLGELPQALANTF